MKTEKQNQNQDCLNKILDYMKSKGMPEYDKVKDGISRLEKRTGISVRSHLAFGNSDKQIKDKSYSNYKDIGEVNSNN